MADRPSLVESLAEQYASAVYCALLGHFPNLSSRTLYLLVREQVGRQAEAPSPAFEVIVDDPSVANWKPIPDMTGPDRWRVQVPCYKVRPSHANARREQRINEALRAITVDVVDRRIHG